MDAGIFQREAMRYERLLYRVASSYLKRPEDCADAVQEALLRAWTKRDTLRSMHAFKSWLCRILVNTCTDMLRHQSIITEVALTDDLPAQEGQAEDTFLLRDAMEQLSPEQRLTVKLHYLEGWSVKEIAGACGLSPNTVKSRLMSARRCLVRALGEGEEMEV